MLWIVVRVLKPIRPPPSRSPSAIVRRLVVAGSVCPRSMRQGCGSATAISLITYRCPARLVSPAHGRGWRISLHRHGIDRSGNRSRRQVRWNSLQGPHWEARKELAVDRTGVAAGRPQLPVRTVLLGLYLALAISGRRRYARKIEAVQKAPYPSAVGPIVSLSSAAATAAMASTTALREAGFVRWAAKPAAWLRWMSSPSP